MSCKEHMNKVLMVPDAQFETITATGPGTEDFGTKLPTFGPDFDAMLIFLKLNTGTPGTANFPVALKVYAVQDSGDAANTRHLILTKCLLDDDGNAYVNWAAANGNAGGKMFLEVNMTHVARFLKNATAATNKGELPFLQVSVEGPVGIDYDIHYVPVCNRYAEPSIVGEELQTS